MLPYHALIQLTEHPDGIHKRVMVEADSLSHAKALLVAEYGKDSVISLWVDEAFETKR